MLDTSSLPLVILGNLIGVILGQLILSYLVNQIFSTLDKKEK